MKYLFRENNNEVKVNKVLDLYRKLLNETNNRSKCIMLIVPNATSKLNYERELNIDISEELNITTYISFIKREIIKFWPLITEKCNQIINKSISPIFIPSSLSEYIIINKVNEQRNASGYFQDITGTNRSIANSISNNINKAALALIDFKTIGEKIYLSKKNRDSIMRFSYSQMDEIIDYYINKLLENSMIDNSIAIYLYENYLINYENIINKIENNINSVNSIKEIDNIELSDIYLLPTKVKLNESSQLYSEMIDEVIIKVIELVNNGIRLKDIAIISPINNTILDYQIKNVLNRNEIKVFNTKKNNKIIDYPYSNALVVATCIFYGYEDYIKEDEYISFIEILLNVNRIQAYKIYRNKEVDENYKNLEKYIISKRSENLKISEFLIKFYIDKMLNLKEGIENVDVCKNIIYESEAFIENIKLLGINNNKEEEKVFIEALKSTINDYYRVSDIADLKESNSIILTTPYSYISYDINRPIQIWVDIGSNAWNMKIEKDISNLIVLRKSFKEKQIYTNEMEEYYKKYYLYNLIYNLLINAKEVYAYKSEYTVNGYIQESILYSILLKLVSKGDV